GVARLRVAEGADRERLFVDGLRVLEAGLELVDRLFRVVLRADPEAQPDREAQTQHWRSSLASPPFLVRPGAIREAGATFSAAWRRRRAPCSGARVCRRP